MFERRIWKNLISLHESACCIELNDALLRHAYSTLKGKMFDTVR